MLLQITNKCFEGCPHCLQASTPDGGMMPFDVVVKTIEVFSKAPIFHVSGGEPTEHPQFLEICELLEKNNKFFSVASNGMFLKDREKTEKVRKVLKMRFCIGVQIYTHKDFYKDYDYISKQKFRNPKITLVTGKIEGMQDLGRAKTCPKAQEYIDGHSHYMSCLNGFLLAQQTHSLDEYLAATVRAGLLCKPLVDINGDVHLSESWHCPSCGNILKDSPDAIFRKMQAFKPCGGCKLYKRFLESTDPRLVIARGMLNDKVILFYTRRER